MDRGDVRAVARKALLQMLEPLVGFVLDSGLSTHELHAILRQAAVKTVAARQLDLARRINISGIAASTGIPRAEISRILKSNAHSPRQTVDRQQQSTNRILAVWHQDARFSTPAGKPADLQIYGRGATFESLVRNYGRGIPTRAMLDELTRAGAAEVISPRLVRVKSSVAVERGITLRGIRSFGDRAAELLSTMLQNMRDPKNPQFVASISGSNVSPENLPLFRRELSNKAADFLANMHDSLIRDTKSARVKVPPTRTSRVSVTIFYNETARKAKPRKKALKKRRNFRRDD
jgi:DNA-binding phage protein